MGITGLHHITLVTADAPRNVDFYTRVLGLRLVKKTVNYDDVSAYHLYYGNYNGDPGTALTFFEWKDVPKGRPGIGGTHHVALEVPDYTALLKWKRRLKDMDLNVTGPYDRHYFKSIYFNDPDGVILELATRGPGWTIDEAPDALGHQVKPPPDDMLVRNRDEDAIAKEIHPEPVDEITDDMALKHGMHHITAISSNIERTDHFLQNVLGLRKVKMTNNFDDPDSPHWYWGVGEGAPGTIVTYFGRDPRDKRYHWAQIGSGQTHHFAFRVPDAEAQMKMRERLLQVGIAVSEVRDRTYFQSIYFRDPDGHILEIATDVPGFAVDEDLAHLGESLKLPEALEPKRKMVEATLTPLDNTNGENQ